MTPQTSFGTLVLEWRRAQRALDRARRDLEAHDGDRSLKWSRDPRVKEARSEILGRVCEQHKRAANAFDALIAAADEAIETEARERT